MYRLVDRLLAAILLLLSIGIAYTHTFTDVSRLGLAEKGEAYELLSATIYEAQPQRLLRLLRAGEIEDVLGLLSGSTLERLGRLAINGRVILERPGPYREYASYTFILEGSSLTVEVWV
jgi:hypothetical protein